MLCDEVVNGVLESLSQEREWFLELIGYAKWIINVALPYRKTLKNVF